MKQGLRNKEKPRIMEIPPKFSKETWSGKSKKAGCYQYALNLDYSKFVLVGDFIDNRCTYTTWTKELIKVLLDELDVLGFDAKQVNRGYELQEGEYFIYLRRSRPMGYYHFSRCDNNGKWSNKFPNEEPEEIDFEEEYVEDGIDRLFEGFLFALKKRDS